MLAIESHLDEYCTSPSSTSSMNDRKPSNLLTINWRPSTSEEKTEFEVTLDSDRQYAGGLAFRIIGSRNSGIFIDQVEEKSSQSGYLKQGDRIVSCGERRLSGLTTEQAAGILRCSVQRTGQVRLKIERDEKGEDLIIRRRSMTCVALEEERSWQQQKEETTSVRPSVSTNSLDRRRVYRVVPSKSTAYLQQSSDEEKEELISPKEKPRLTRSFYSFDTSDFRERETCRICNKETRLKTLHLISHRCMDSARRIIPYSRSDGAFSANYSLL